MRPGKARANRVSRMRMVLCIAVAVATAFLLKSIFASVQTTQGLREAALFLQGSMKRQATPESHLQSSGGAAAVPDEVSSQAPQVQLEQKLPQLFAVPLQTWLASDNAVNGNPDATAQDAEAPAPPAQTAAPAASGASLPQPEPVPVQGGPGDAVAETVAQQAADAGAAGKAPTASDAGREPGIPLGDSEGAAASGTGPHATSVPTPQQASGSPAETQLGLLVQDGPAEQDALAATPTNAATAEAANSTPAAGFGAGGVQQGRRESTSVGATPEQQGLREGEQLQAAAAPIASEGMDGTNPPAGSADSAQAQLPVAAAGGVSVSRLVPEEQVQVLREAAAEAVQEAAALLAQRGSNSSRGSPEDPAAPRQPHVPSPAVLKAASPVVQEALELLRGRGVPLSDAEQEDSWAGRWDRLSQQAEQQHLPAGSFPLPLTLQADSAQTPAPQPSTSELPQQTAAAAAPGADAGPSGDAASWHDPGHGRVAGEANTDAAAAAAVPDPGPALDNTVQESAHEQMGSSWSPAPAPGLEVLAEAPQEGADSDATGGTASSQLPRTDPVQPSSQASAVNASLTGDLGPPTVTADSTATVPDGELSSADNSSSRAMGAAGIAANTSVALLAAGPLLPGSIHGQYRRVDPGPLDRGFLGATWKRGPGFPLAVAVRPDEADPPSVVFSLGKVKGASGNALVQGVLKQVAQARSVDKEVILLVGDGSEVMLQLLLNMLLMLRQWGWAHYIVFMDSDAACKKLLGLVPDAGCVWLPLLEEVREHLQVKVDRVNALWLLRWLVFTKLLQWELNVLMLDVDVTITHDVYKVLRSPQLSEFNLIMAEEGGLPGINCGTAYVRGVRADGPVAWMSKEVSDRVLRWTENQTALATTWPRARQNPSWYIDAAVFEQGVFNDAACSAIAGKQFFGYSMLPRDSDFSDLDWRDFHGQECLPLRQYRDVEIPDSWLPFVGDASTTLRWYRLCMPLWDAVRLPPNTTSPFQPRGVPSTRAMAMWRDMDLDRPAAALDIETAAATGAALAEQDGPGCEKPELFLQAPTWLFGRYCAEGRHGRWDPARFGVGKHVSSVVAHFVCIRGEGQQGKLGAMKVFGWWFWEVSKMVSPPPKLGPKPILALAPDLRLRADSRPATMQLLVSLLKLGYMSGRDVVIPPIDCESEWVAKDEPGSWYGVQDEQVLAYGRPPQLTCLQLHFFNRACYRGAITWPDFQYRAMPLPLEHRAPGPDTTLLYDEFRRRRTAPGNNGSVAVTAEQAVPVPLETVLKQVRENPLPIVYLGALPQDEPSWPHGTARKGFWELWRGCGYHQPTH